MLQVYNVFELCVCVFQKLKQKLSGLFVRYTVYTSLIRGLKSRSLHMYAKGMDVHQKFEVTVCSSLVVGTHSSDGEVLLGLLCAHLSRLLDLFFIDLPLELGTESLDIAS